MRFRLSQRTFLLSMLLTACTSSPEKENHSSTSFRIETAFEMRLEDESCSDAACSYVRVAYPRVVDLPGVSETISVKVLASTSQFVRDQGDARMESVMRAFINDYREFKESFPESITPWYLKVTAQVNYASPSIVAGQIVSDSYTGGAHGAQSLEFFTLDRHGHTLNPAAFVVDMKGFKILAEKKFREQKGLSASADLGESGYWFENDEFTLPENIGLFPDKVVLYYNAYEIGPYAMGSVRIEIPINQLDGMLDLNQAS